MLDYYYMAQQPYYKPVCEYSQQEEEWDREGLLDPAWERQQKKTFTAWCNSHLRKAGTGIEAIEEDFQNGLKLMLLLEVISGETLGRPDRGKLRFHQIANVNKALEYIESKGVKLVSIGAEEIVDGNVKMTLGLIWTIILRFAIQNINVGELSARDGLLLWCQRKTAPYDNVNVQNFTTSWKDGLAFCALIHRHRPELIDYSQLGRRDPVSNLNLAFDIAEKHLDIPKMLDAEDIHFSSRPDEKSIITYVSCFYHAFESEHAFDDVFDAMPMTASVNLPPILNGTNYFPNCDDLNGNFRPRWRRAYSPFLPLSCGPPVTNGHSLRPLGIPEMYATSIPISVEARHRVDPLPTVEPPLFRRDVPIQLHFEANSYLAIREETYSRTEEEVSELTSPMMVGTASPDEKAIMTYVSSYYHCFLNMNKATTAAKRICRVLNLTRESEQLMGEYDEIVTNILDWIDKWLPRLRDRSTTANESVEAMRRRMDEFRQYRCVEKPPRVEEKGRLETLFSTVQTKLRLNNRPAFAPTERRLIKDVNKAWQCLEQAENGFEEWLQNEINRLERLDLLAEKFYQKCKVHQEWMDGKEERLKSTDYLCSDFYRIKALRKRQEAFESDFAAHEERVVQIKGISAELADNGYHDITTVRQRCSAVEAEWERMRELSSRRSESLEQAERTLERLDNFHLAFAKRVVPFNNWLDSARDDLTEVMVRPCGEEIDRLMDAFNAFRQTLVDAHKEFHQIQEFHRDIVEVVVTNRLHNELLKNPYTDLSPEGIIKKWKDVQALVPEREKNLRSEQSKSRTNELLHQSFADKANQMGPWMEAKLQEVLKIGMGLSGGLEDSVTQLKAIHKEVQSRRANLDELERVNRELQEKFVNVSTKESRYSMESLRVAWEHLLTSVNRVISECENQVLLRDSKNIKEELLSEYRSSFNHFDKERLGLNDEQLKACLISVGYNLRGSAANGRRDIGVEDIRGIMARVDPNGTGRVQFDAFLDFMTSETADSDTADQLISSFRVLSNGKSEIDAETIRLELPTEYADYLIEKMTNYRITTAAKKTADTFAYTTFSKELYS